MNKIKTAFIVAILLSVSAHLFGETFEVNYLSGTAEVKTGADWLKLNIGDKFDEKASVRVASQSVLEVKSPKGIMYFKNPGTYIVGDIYKKMYDNPRLSKLNKKLSDRHVVVPTNKNSTTAGVRAEDKTAKGDNFKTDADPAQNKENAETEASISKAYNDGDYDQALSLIKTAYTKKGSNIEWLQLQESAVNIKQEHYASATGILEKMKLTQKSPLYFERLSLLLQAYLGSQEFDLAIKTSDELAKSKEKDDKQLAFLLKGYALQGKNKPKDANASFTKARDLDPKSPLGAEAAEALKG